MTYDQSKRSAISRAGAASEQALVRLIRRYERTLVGLIRHRVGSGDQVQDVLQETL